MATIDKRDDYQWRVQIRRKGWPRQSQTFETRRDAEAWARQIESEMDRGVFVDRSEADSTSLREALERYLKEVTPLKKGAEQEKYVIKKLIGLKLSLRPLSAVRSTDIANLRDELMKTLSASTTHKHLAVISNLYSVSSKDWGMPLPNPVLGIRKPKIDNSRDRRLTTNEEKYLLDALENPGVSAGRRANHWMAPLVRVALATGMRQGELLKMRWSDVDLTQRFVLLRDTKNGDDRAVPLSTYAASILERLPRSTSGRVFPTTQSAVKQSWARAILRAQRNYAAECKESCTELLSGFLDDFHFHDARHEALSRLAERGDLSILDLASISGHKTMQMLKRYTHLRAADLAKKLG